MPHLYDIVTLKNERLLDAETNNVARLFIKLKLQQQQKKIKIHMKIQNYLIASQIFG